MVIKEKKKYSISVKINFDVKLYLHQQYMCNFTCLILMQKNTASKFNNIENDEYLLQLLNLYFLMKRCSQL